MRGLAGMAAGVALLAGGGGAWAQAAKDKLLTTLSVAEVRALAVETGGVPGAVRPLEDNKYRMEIRYPDGLPIYFEGWSCTGEGEDMRCPEFQMHVWFGFDSEAEALAKEREVSIVWLSDRAYGPDLKVWRMDYLGGMTRGRMLSQFYTFLDTVGAARAIAYDEDEAVD